LKKEAEIRLMCKGAIFSFAFLIFFYGCTTKISYEPSPSSSPPAPTSLSIISNYETLNDERGEETIQEEETQGEAKRPEAVPETPVLVSIPIEPEPPKEHRKLPDLTVTHLSLDQKRRLVATLANIGEAPFSVENGEVSVRMDGKLEKEFYLKSFSAQTLLQPNESMTVTTPLIILGRHEIEARIETSKEMEETNRKNNSLKKVLEGFPVGPDIVLKGLYLAEDLDLSLLLSNKGEVDLRKGATFQIKIFLNGRKVSDFEHFNSEILKAHSGNQYLLGPPYRIEIKGMAQVKAFVLPKLHSDDIRLENNMIERTFIVFPFQIGGQEKDEFSFKFSPSWPKGEYPGEKMMVEVRWEEGGSPLVISFKESGNIKNPPAVSGKSPLRIEFPIEESQRESRWRISISNMMKKKVEGHLIIQH